MRNDEKIAAIRQYMNDNPKEADCPVLNAVIRYLGENEIEQAQYKVKLDSDKFWNPKKMLRFLDTLGLVDNEYRSRLQRNGTL